MGTDPLLPGLTADDGSSRRAFLTKVALGGAALTVGSQLVPATRLVPRAGAQEGDEVTLDADETQSRFLASLALAANQVYRATLDRPTPLPEPMTELVRAFGAHHTRQATALVGLLPTGTSLDSVPANPTFLAEQTAAVEGAGGTEEVLGALRTLEEAVAASQFAALGSIEAQDDARLVATLLATTAQRATVLGALSGQTLTEVLPPTQDDAQALDPAAYPVGEAPEGGDGPEGGETTPTTGPGGQGAEPDGEGGTGQTGDDPGTAEG